LRGRGTSSLSLSISFSLEQTGGAERDSRGGQG